MCACTINWLQFGFPTWDYNSRWSVVWASREVSTPRLSNVWAISYRSTNRDWNSRHESVNPPHGQGTRLLNPEKALRGARLE